MSKRTTVFVALRHSDGVMIASKSKTAIAKHCGISYHTVWRNINGDGLYRTEAYSIWYDVELIPAR